MKEGALWLLVLEPLFYIHVRLLSLASDRRTSWLEHVTQETSLDSNLEANREAGIDQGPNVSFKGTPMI